MESRNTRSYREFLQKTLHVDDHPDMYDGVCFLSAHGGGIEYAQGSFTRSTDTTSNSSHHLNVDLHDDSSTTASSLLDTRQFLRAFEQIARCALQQETRLHSSKTGSGKEEDAHEEEEAPFTSVFQVGDSTFHVVFSSFTTVCAVASGKTHGLVVEKLPIGVLVVLFRQPYSVESVLPRVSRYCQPLRR